MVREEMVHSIKAYYRIHDNIDFIQVQQTQIR